MRRGDIKEAYEFIKEFYPTLLEEKPLILSLFAQLFLELMRKGEINEGISLAQSSFYGSEEEILDFIDQNGKIVEMKLEVSYFIDRI